MRKTVMQSGALVYVALIALVLSPFPLVSADGGAGHQTVQSRPIQLGTSGGNITDFSFPFCCSGTLGSLVQDGNGDQYILSNNHVLANFNQGSPGDGVNQPGMIDQNCEENGIVANLTDWVDIKTAKGRRVFLNEVDAAIAEVVPGQVSPDGAILDIGPASVEAMNAFLEQPVQKSGRTSGHTTGTVKAIDVVVDVGYSENCNGAANNVARFINQIRIEPAAFSTSGDSGSLILEHGDASLIDNKPRAVGLLFAGTSSSTIANPIGRVLDLLGVSMASGAAAQPGPAGSVTGTVNVSGGGPAIEGATVSADTGQSSTTNALGQYTIGNVPEGDRTITASAIGYVSAQANTTVVANNASVVNFGLDVALEPTSVAIGCVTFETSGGPNGDKHLYIRVRVVDNFGNPVAGAIVSVDVERDGASIGSGVLSTTNENGIAGYTAKNQPTALYEVTAASATADGLTFVEGSLPENSTFLKGVEQAPKSICNDGVSPSGASEGLPQHLSRASAAKARASQQLLGIPGVVGHGVGLSDSGKPVIEVYLANENAATRAQVPAHVENIRTRVVVTGAFEAY